MHGPMPAPSDDIVTPRLILRLMGRETGRIEAALWANGAADLVHDPGAALHEDLWPLARATGDGLGRAARMGGQARAPPSGADHRRGCAELA